MPSPFNDSDDAKATELGTEALDFLSRFVSKENRMAARDKLIEIVAQAVEHGRVMAIDTVDQYIQSRSN